METLLRKENSIDRIKNHLSVFLAFEELNLEAFENRDFIFSFYNAMENSYKELSTLLKEYDEVEDFNQFSIATLLLDNYLKGYKSVKDVLQAKNDLRTEKTVYKILSTIENAPPLT